MKNFTNDYDKVYSLALTSYKEKNKTKSKKSINKYHINNIFALDTEDTSGFLQKDGTVIPYSHDFYENWLKSVVGKATKPVEYSNPISLMYIWQCAVESGDEIITFYGRTYQELNEFVSKLDDAISNFILFGSTQISIWQQDTKNFKGTCGDKIYLHFYVHNLAYDYQFLRNVFKFENVFARTMRKPMKAEVKLNMTTIIFHDTLSLVQKSLENWAKDEKLPVQKAVGKLDYNKIHTPLTPLTDDEIEYCANDVIAMVHGIKKYRDKYNGHLSEIPMTQTGEIRRVCRQKISAQNNDWAKLCYEIDHNYSFEFFNHLCQAFMGGWTHANQRYSGRLLGLKSENDKAFGDMKLKAYDFASSYPAVMTTRRFPVSDFREIDEQRLDYLDMLELHDSPYRFMVCVEIKDFYTKTQNTFYSSSKCIESEGLILDNGKINYGEKIVVTLTDLDWDLFRKSYAIGEYKILKAWEADADYLPKEMILTILDYFGKKTSFKGVAGMESCYVESKQWINSIYGVMVTKLITDIISYRDGNGWVKSPITEDEFIEKMQIPEKPDKLQKEISETFTTYQAGVWVTAWARHNLWDAILHLDNKTVYCDTDSIKGFFDDNDVAWFNDYNNHVTELQEEVANHYGFSPDLFKATTPAGDVKQLGIFASEYGDGAILFKTLGAKRDVSEWIEDGERHIETTIAGLPKKSGLKLIKTAADFNINMKWSPRIADKNMATYSDNVQGKVYKDADWTDENGITYHSTDRYGIAIQPVGFDLSLSDEYQQLLNLLSGIPDSDYFDITKCLRDYNFEIDNE